MGGNLMPSSGKRITALRRRAQEAGKYLDRWQQSGGDPGVFHLRRPAQRIGRVATTPRNLSREEITKMSDAFAAWQSKSRVRSRKRQLT